MGALWIIVAPSQSPCHIALVCVAGRWKKSDPSQNLHKNIKCHRVPEWKHKLHSWNKWKHYQISLFWYRCNVTEKTNWFISIHFFKKKLKVTRKWLLGSTRVVWIGSGVEQEVTSQEEVTSEQEMMLQLVSMGWTDSDFIFRNDVMMKNMKTK